MVKIPYQFNAYTINGAAIQLAIPEAAALKEAWENGSLPAFPFWGKCWPAAEALAEFISKDHSYIDGKSVLEIGGGLGLPSLAVAKFAAHVTCTDHVSEPQYYFELSAQKNNVHNVQYQLMDWYHLPNEISEDVILLSDINYRPADFQQLQHVLQQFLDSNKTLILSTPQRLMAKEFMAPLAPFIQREKEFGPISDTWVWCGILKK